MSIETKKIGEPSPHAIDFAKRMIALKWTKGTSVDTIASCWQAGYLFGQIDAGAKYGKEWISVETELPKGIPRVLCLCESGHIEVGYYDSEWQSDNTFKTFKERGYVVTHWMLLPEPPKS